MTHFIPCDKTDDTTKLVICSADRLQIQGVPRSIISDTNITFLSYFWKMLWENLGTKLLFSTTCHPQTNGQTEVINRTLT